MSVRTGFFNSYRGDRKYTAQRFAEYFATFIGNGVFPNPSNGFQIMEFGGMVVSASAGKAWLNGYFIVNDENYLIKLDPADGVLSRIDRIVLRYDVNKRDILITVKKGKFNSNPTPPALQRDEDAYELALADITIRRGAISISQADITDLRLNKELCGIVHGLVEQVDTTAIFNQFESWYKQTKNKYNEDIEKWTQEKKEAFDRWYRENTEAFEKWFNQNTQNFKEQWTEWYDTNTVLWESDFEKWFDGIKAQLDGDVAAKLTQKTIELEKKIDAISSDSIIIPEWGMSVEDAIKENRQNIEGTMSDVTNLQKGLAKTDENLNSKMDKVVKDDATSKKYQFGIKNGLLYYKEV